VQIKSSGQIDPPGVCGDFPVFLLVWGHGTRLDRVGGLGNLGR